MPLPKDEWRLPRAKRKGPFSQYINSEKALFHSENAFMLVEKTCDMISQGLPVSEQDGGRTLRTHFRTEIRDPFFFFWLDSPSYAPLLKRPGMFRLTLDTCHSESYESTTAVGKVGETERCERCTHLERTPLLELAQTPRKFC